jgi:thiol-disulfide isomerase/thioredoxin
MKHLVTFCLLFLFTLLFRLPVMAQTSSVVMEFFYSEGCPHCAKEKIFLSQLQVKYPDLVIQAYEISQNPLNAALLEERGQALGADVSGVPFTIVGDRYLIGFRDQDTSGKQLEALILSANNPSPMPDTPAVMPNPPPPQPNLLVLPLLGTVDVAQLSLPVLTLVIALMDGFNPCAMWALLFLISLLLGMKDRKRMWVLGTAFIVTSAAVYFLFLSAWLNLFLFIGMLVWVRLAIGLVALIAGGIYLRDYYQHRTSCVVAGNEKRQQVFNRLREITATKQFFVALIGIILLAIAVNLVELICSAGLPAVYTHVLSLSNLPPWQYYLYLLLYVFIFMLDDLFIFFTAMLTLKAVGIDSKYASISRLIGGIVMIIIGILLLFKPSLLMFG